jgi:HSP20 family protein
MSQSGGQPLHHFHRIRGELNRLIELLLEEPATPQASWLPPVDLIEREDGIEVQVELPGVSPSDLSLELSDQLLLLRGTKPRLEEEPSGGRFYLMERFIGGFAVTVELPHPVLPERSSARLERGVLTVRLAKMVERRHRRHPIPVTDE